MDRESGVVGGCDNGRSNGGVPQYLVRRWADLCSRRDSTRQQNQQRILASNDRLL